jgi:hypothetical protein
MPVQAVDAYGNVVGTYNTTVSWTSDSGWVEGRLTYVVNGIGTAILSVGGFGTVTITGTDDNGITGTFQVTFQLE